VSGTGELIVSRFKVHIQGVLFSLSGLASRVSFSTERSPLCVNWEQSERLTPGSIIALSPSIDNFRSQCLVAVVAARPLYGGVLPDRKKDEDENTPPRIDIFWARPIEEAVFDPNCEMVMIQAKSGYYETVRYAMLGFQHEAIFE
jgi:helicase required for RNAi-mediated heterochromatin assembly 1